MRLTCVAVVDRSRMFKGARSAILDRIVQAVQTQVERDFCPAWGRHPLPILRVEDNDPVPLGSALVYLVDKIEVVAGAVGFHRADPMGFFSGSVAVESIARLGGTMTSGGNSVSAALSHEVLEVIANPGVNYWVERNPSELFAMEVCDPVSADSYEVEVGSAGEGNKSTVSVSNFVYPDWFHPFASSGSWYDHMQRLDSPFSCLPGGYVSVKGAGGMERRFDEKVPVLKRLRIANWGRSARAKDALEESSVIASRRTADPIDMV